MKISGFDRFLLSVAPSYGISRLKARSALESLKRHYEAAQPGRRTENWNRGATDADLTLRAAARDLRNLARDLLRNNSYARRGQNTIANNTVGAGIIPKAVDADSSVLAKAQQLWKTWGATPECESDNRLSFYGIQHLAMRSLVSDGEVFLRRRGRRESDGLTIPLQVQVLEADYLATQVNQFASSDKTDVPSLAGGPIIQGIEFDKLGRRAAYWMWSDHPGSGRNISAPKRIPASEVIHLYDVERPGQSRGVSWLAAAIVNLQDLDAYEDAELMKQKIAACFAAFVTDTDGMGSPLGEQSSTNPLVETLEPGMISYLPAGKQVSTANPPTLTSDTLAIRTLRRVAAGLGVTYEDLTGDYSQVNFSSARMARIAHWANVEQWRENMLIPLVCAPVWCWAMDAAQLSGLIPVAPSAEWTPPPMPMIEPDKEGLALQRMVRGGFKTLSQAVREQGRDPVSHWAEYAADLKMLDAAGIVVDSDARLTTQSGQEQPSETADKAPPAPTPVVAAKSPVKRAEDFDIDVVAP